MMFTFEDVLTGKVGTDTDIAIEKNSETLETAKAVSDYLSSLPLTVEQNDRLVYLMADNLMAALRNGFLEGVKFAVTPSSANGPSQ